MLNQGDIDEFEHMNKEEEAVPKGTTQIDAYDLSPGYKIFTLDKKDSYIVQSVAAGDRVNSFAVVVTTTCNKRFMFNADDKINVELKE